MKLTGVLLLASCALLSTLCVANARSIMAANEQDDYEAVLQDLYDTMALKQEGDEGNKVAKAQFWGILAQLAAPLIANAVSNLIPRGNGEVALEQEDGDDYEARLQEAVEALAKLQQEDDSEIDLAKLQGFFKIFKHVAKHVGKHLIGGALGGGGGRRGGGAYYYDAEEQQDDDYPNAQLQDLYDSLALNQEEDDDEDGDKEAQMQKFRFSKIGRSFKKFGRKALRIGRRVGKGVLKHGGPIAGQIIGGALAGRGGANYPSYGGGYQYEAMEQ